MLKHIIFLRFKDYTPEGHISEFCQRMSALENSIEELLHIEAGRDILGDSRSWSLALVMHFTDLAALRTYRDHPAHRDVMAFNDPWVADIAAVDYTVP